ncbi:hypothetical protein CONLIGDRAFT_184728 [Coniochaeta ligniaria NRRL 30616]|uniref:Uncharacterized protein n=1 Tax=Coniochaeta ligniaria NRRL 30616 TaxID=1408157 RepID=A0A1J7JW16_9PEZI|nr:hypothetical protein CONLIGDRAFT_184728 [Coniochaeta ligniaria NRRL 30616]
MTTSASWHQSAAELQETSSRWIAAACSYAPAQLASNGLRSSTSASGVIWTKRGSRPLDSRPATVVHLACRPAGVQLIVLTQDPRSSLTPHVANWTVGECHQSVHLGDHSTPGQGHFNGDNCGGPTFNSASATGLILAPAVGVGIRRRPCVLAAWVANQALAMPSRWQPRSTV